MKTLQEKVNHTLSRYPEWLTGRFTIRFFDYEEFLFAVQIEDHSFNWTLPKLQEYLRVCYFAETLTPVRFQPNRKHHYRKAIVKIEVKLTSSSLNLFNIMKYDKSTLFAFAFIGFAIIYTVFTVVVCSI